MDEIERQPQGPHPVARRMMASGIRQDGAGAVRKGAQPAREGGDATRHVRDILADFLQCDAKG